MNDEEYIYLQEQILKLTGIDLTDYKSAQMRRRLDGFIFPFSPALVWRPTVRCWRGTGKPCNG